MNDHDEKLANLWQQQPTQTLDPVTVKKAITRMRIKQFFYVFLDFMGVLVCLGFLFISREDMSSMLFYSIAFVCFIAFGFSLYLLYLRRFILFNQSQSTNDYLNILKQQTRSNIKIARFTQHSCWVSFLMITGIWILTGIVDDIPVDEWRQKFLISTGLGAVFLFPFWWWAKKRAEKFTSEVKKLEKQTDSQ